MESARGRSHGACARSAERALSYPRFPALCASLDERGSRSLSAETASGRATKSELHGYGQNEFVPWQLGAVM